MSRYVRNGFIPQTNVVRFDGARATMLDIQKIGSASTLDIVDGIKKKLPEVQQTLPPGAEGLHLSLLTDQSIFVSASIQGVLREAIIAACLTALMILLFLSSWRSTLIICVSIPLSILCSIVVLSALGETINIMTLGGMALAVGILVDDATVEIENIHRNMAEGGTMEECILNGAAQIAVPAFVSTLCICIVFVPIFFLSDGEVSLRAAGRGGGLCHVGLLPPLANGRPDFCQVPAASGDGPSPFIRAAQTEKYLR